MTWSFMSPPDEYSVFLDRGIGLIPVFGVKLKRPLTLNDRKIRSSVLVPFQRDATGNTGGGLKPNGQE